MGGTCGMARLWNKINVGSNSVKNPEGKSPLEIPGRRREVNMKIELKSKCDGTAWTGFIWLRTGGHGNKDRLP
jgi:hypothetical protein